MRDLTGKEIDHGDTIEYRHSKRSKPKVYKVVPDDDGKLCAEAPDGTRRCDFHLNISICGYNTYEKLEQQLKIIKRTNRQLVAILQITTWVGTCGIGATHYYGKLYLGTSPESHNLEYKLSVSQAKALNKKDYDFGREYTVPVKPGEMDERFDDPDHVRREAIAQWRTIYPEAILLVEGMYAVYGVQDRVLDGPKKLVATLQKLVDRQNELGGGYDEERKNWKELDALCAQRRKIIDEWKEA